MIRFAQRHAGSARDMAGSESDPQRKAELEHIARRLPTGARPRPARSLGGPAVLLVRPPGGDHRTEYLGLVRPRASGPAPCSLSTERDIAEGSLTRERAAELLQCFWIKFNNQPAPPKVGVTAAESGTYTDFAQINLGGVKADGSDGVNEVTYLLLDVVEEMRLLQPSSSIQVSKKNPDRLSSARRGSSAPGSASRRIFNADAIVQELVRQGKAVATRAWAARAAAWRSAHLAKRTTT